MEGKKSCPFYYISVGTRDEDDDEDDDDDDEDDDDDDECRVGCLRNSQLAS